MFTNNRYVGESFGKQIISELKRSKHLEIASGYFSHELLNQQRQPLLEIAKRGSCKLLFGMIYHERVTSKQRDCLLELDQELRKINPKSGIYI